jgi:hypothetical protein
MARDSDGRRDKTFSFLEGVIALGALTTSSAAVFIAWDQAQIMRADQQSAVQPAIQIDRWDLDEGASVSSGFNIENAGVGPAFIKSATLYKVSGKNKEKVDGLEGLATVMPSGMVPETEQLTGRTMAPALERTAIRMRWRSDFAEPAQRMSIFVATGELQLEVCYCSTFDRCWVATSGSREHPRQISGVCPKPDANSF